MSIENIRRYAELCQQGDSTLSERLALFERQREIILTQMEDLKRHLETVERKIKIYTDEYAAYKARGGDK